MNSRVEDILKHNNLSITAGRKKILGLFLTHAGALAHADIEKKAGEKFDRVTVYRTLQAFVEKGILHTIPSSDNNIRYALCTEECYAGHHHDDHVHFVCRLCGKTTCITDSFIPEIKLPRGYATYQVEVLVHGVCKNCKS